MTPPGYKQTEVGVIPEEWEVFRLVDLIDYTKGFPFKSVDYQTAGVRIIRVSDTSHDSIKEEDPIFVSEARAAQYATWRLKEHDLIVSTVGSKPPMYDSMVGKVILIEQSHTNTLLNQNAVIIRDRKRRAHVQQLLLSHLRTRRYLTHIEAIYRGNANQASITLKELFQFGIPLPKNDAEQRAIATALSDVDALLASLDRLIAKKRDLKQAAMQQLLTGQTRLPGFKDEWVVKQISNIAPLQRGFDLPNPDLRPGPHPVVYSNGTMNYHAKAQVQGPGVVTGRSGTIGNVTFVEEPYWPHNTALWVTSFKGNNPHFVFYLYTKIGFERFATGSGVPTLNRNDVHSFEVKIPPTVEEQTAIAAVLTEMDAELAALEQRQAKTRALKQGMMQELLTGKTRLI